MSDGRRVSLECLSDFIEIKHGYAFQSRYFSQSGDYALLTPGNFNEAGGFRELGQSQKRYAGPVAPDFVLRAGDVLVAMTEQAPGLLGAAIKIPEGDTFLHNQRLGRISLKQPDRISLSYLYHLFNSSQIRREISASAGGTKVKHTSPTKIQALAVALPDLREQEEIVAILDYWDHAIVRTGELIARKERLKSGYETRLFPTGDDAKTPRLRADSLFVPVSEKLKGDLEVLSVTQDRGVIPRRMLDKQILMNSSNTAAFKAVRKGDFVISLRSFEGGLEFSAYDGVVSPAYTVLRPVSRIVPEYFRHYLKSKDFLRRLSVAVIGIRDGKQISFADFASIKLPVPNRDQQNKTARVFDALEREIDLLKQQLAALLKQKRGLMQKLLTGELSTSGNGRAQAT